MGGFSNHVWRVRHEETKRRLFLEGRHLLKLGRKETAPHADEDFIANMQRFLFSYVGFIKLNLKKQNLLKIPILV